MNARAPHESIQLHSTVDSHMRICMRRAMAIEWTQEDFGYQGEEDEREEMLEFLRYVATK